jgi:hypothetical protein
MNDSFFMKAVLNSSRPNSAQKAQSSVRITSRPSSPSKFDSTTNFSHEKITNPFELTQKVLKQSSDNINSIDFDSKESANMRKTRKQHWKTSSNLSLSYKCRPNSANPITKRSPSPNKTRKEIVDLNKNLRNNNELTVNSDLNTNKLTKSTTSLFLDYSKLIEIESKFNQEYNQYLEELSRFDLLNSAKYASYNLLDKQQKIQTLNININTLCQENNEDKKISEPLSVIENDESNQKFEHLLLVNSKIDWLALPDEIWLQILKLLKHSDLSHFGQTCKTFNRLYLDNTLCES